MTNVARVCGDSGLPTGNHTLNNFVTLNSSKPHNAHKSGSTIFATISRLENSVKTRLSIDSFNMKINIRDDNECILIYTVAAAVNRCM